MRARGADSQTFNQTKDRIRQHITDWKQAEDVRRKSTGQRLMPDCTIIKRRALVLEVPALESLILFRSVHSCTDVYNKFKEYLKVDDDTRNEICHPRPRLLHYLLVRIDRHYMSLGIERDFAGSFLAFARHVGLDVSESAREVEANLERQYQGIIRGEY